MTNWKVAKNPDQPISNLFTERIMVFVSTFDDPHSGRDLARRTNPFIVTISDLYIADQGNTKVFLIANFLSSLSLI